jgi:hypothetical protein
MTTFHLPPVSNSHIAVMEVIFVSDHIYMYVFCCALLSVESDVMETIINVGWQYKL